MLLMGNRGILSTRNNDDAFFTLMTTHYNYLFRYGIRFTADVEDTKDIVNDFFLKAWEQRDKFVAADNTRAYLLVAFRHFLLNSSPQCLSLSKYCSAFYCCA